MDERTRIVVSDLGITVTLLLALERINRSFPDANDPLDGRSVVAGAISGMATQYVSERGPVAAKLQRYRYRFAHSLITQASQRLFCRFLPSQRSVSAGYLIGIALNRLLFGVVFDVPEGRRRLQRTSLLARWRTSSEEHE